MDKSQDSVPRGHTRTRSGVKATRPRSSTKGPLDDDNPLASPPLSADHTQRNLSIRNNPRSPGPGSPMMPRSPARSPAPTDARMSMRGTPSPRHGPKDFSYLLHPDLYHPLTPLNLPASFRAPAEPPSPDTPIPDLVARGYFRAAAIAATQALTGGAVSPTDHATIFDLLYTRLACLTLIDATPLAAQEAKALGDLQSAFYYSPSSSAESQNEQPQSPLPQQHMTHLCPWPLRVLAVRLQAMGFGDPRRAVMSYYELAREARAKLGEAKARHEHSEAEVWRQRLADLGLRVAGTLVEMDDLSGAVEHLETLKEEGRGRMGGLRKSLLWLQLGDVEVARECVKTDDGGDEEGVEERVVSALCDTADGEYEVALGKWTALRKEVDDEMVGVNLAVCLLYVGRMQEGKVLLESLVDAGRSSHTLLFNLTTMYELCTDRSRALKVRLSEKVAAMGERADGWEKSNADFKL